MKIEERLRLIKEVGEEIIDEGELKALLEKKKNPIAYDGFEPSGNIHIAQGLLRTININKMTKAGCRFKMLVADWHGWANNKMGGDLDKIQATGRYMIEVWKACGMDLSKVEFVWANELMKSQEYLKTVMQVARHSTVNRIVRCSQIMGRSESDALQASQILYPCMQTADIFHLGVDICQLGMDQRKVNMLAREIGEKIGYYKPVIVSHKMMMGLLPPPKDASNAEERAMAMKMSKSKPDSAIFMTDSSDDVKRKMKKAYCPEGEVQDNPILEYFKYIIFEKYDSILIERPEKFGGNLIFNSYNELESAFKDKKVHPLDLKASCAKYVDELLVPVRLHFEKDKNAKKLLETVRSFEITR